MASPSRTPESTRTAPRSKGHALGQRIHLQRAGGGQEVVVGVLGADARLDGVAVDAQLVLRSGSGSPAATRSCHSTRSRPVMASVTGCSTCRRVFISMK
jgi:hypothetical protein